MNRVLHRYLTHTPPAMTMLACAIALAMATPAFSQAPASHSKIDASDCKACHTCEKPTAETPCLITCPRPKTAIVEQVFRAGEGPQGRHCARHAVAGIGHQGQFRPGYRLITAATPVGLKSPAAANSATTTRPKALPIPPAGPATSLNTAWTRRWPSRGSRALTTASVSAATASGATRRNARPCHFARLGNEGESHDPAQVTVDDDVMGSMHPPIPEPRPGGLQDRLSQRDRLEGLLPPSASLGSVRVRLCRVP